MRRLALTLTIVLCLWRPGVLEASEARTLGGYRFIPTPEVRDPFTTTHFRNVTAILAASGLDIPLLVVPMQPPDTLGVKGDFIVLVIEMEYQYAFNNRITLRGDIYANSRIGTSGQSLLAQGVMASGGGVLGTTVAIWRGNKTLLSGIADLRFGPVLVVDLTGFVEDIVSGNSNAPSLLKSEDRSTIAGGLSIAQALNGWSGLTGFAQIGNANGSISGSNTVWGAGLAASIDFDQRDQAPLGLLLSVDATDASNTTAFIEGVAFGVGLSILYTGRDDLNLGAEIKWSRIPLEFNDVDANTIGVAGVLRYFF